jgi:hypothetical protein
MNFFKCMLPTEPKPEVALVEGINLLRLEILRHMKSENGNFSRDVVWEAAKRNKCTDNYIQRVLEGETQSLSTLIVISGVISDFKKEVAKSMAILQSV